MNCQELTELLDNGDLRHLTGGERRAVDAHLAGCPDCAAEWRVQMRIARTPIPPPLPGFIVMCRRLVAAGAARRFGGRLVVVGALVVLAAAAAVLGWYLLTPPPVAEQPIEASVVDPPVEVLPVVEPVAEPTPEPPMPQPVAPLPRIFTVAVWPLQSEGIDTEGKAMAERFRERVIALLQGVPNLVVVDTQAGDASSQADFELRMKYAAALAAPLPRNLQLEIRTAAEIAAEKAAIEAEATMSPGERQRRQEERRFAELQKRGFSTPGGNTMLGLLLGPGVPILVTIDTVGPSPGDRIGNSAQLLVSELRIKVFPLDAAYEQQQLEALSKPTQPDKIRLRALGALLNYAERRGGFPQMSPAAVRAGGEFALTWDSDIVLTRSMVWDGMALTRSPELVPYLIRGLDEAPRTEIRLRLVKILADIYGDDPRAKAALADAAKNNDQQAVRMAALRETGDSRWAEYVGKALMDRTLTDLQRLQPVADMVPAEMGRISVSPKSKLVLDDQQLDEFVAIIKRIALDTAAVDVVQKALIAVGAMDTPAALDMLIEVVNVLQPDDVTGRLGLVASRARTTARSLISYRYAGNPKARAFMEGLANSSDPLERTMVQAELSIMDMKAKADRKRKEQQTAPQPVQ